MQHVINATANAHVFLLKSDLFPPQKLLDVKSPDSISRLAIRPSMPLTSSWYIIAPARPLSISPVGQSVAAWAEGHPDFADLWVPPPFLVSGCTGMEQEKADCEHSMHAVWVCLVDVVISGVWLVWVPPSLCYFRQPWPWPQPMTMANDWLMTDWWQTDEGWQWLTMNDNDSWQWMTTDQRQMMTDWRPMTTDWWLMTANDNWLMIDDNRLTTDWQRMTMANDRQQWTTTDWLQMMTDCQRTTTADNRPTTTDWQADNNWLTTRRPLADNSWLLTNDRLTSWQWPMRRQRPPTSWRWLTNEETTTDWQGDDDWLIRWW